MQYIQDIKQVYTGEINGENKEEKNIKLLLIYSDKDDLNILKDSKRKIVITPHMGEMSRLTGVSINDINEDKVNIAVNFANKYGIIVLLKGYNTIITNWIEVYVNPTGNSKMASGENYS